MTLPLDSEVLDWVKAENFPPDLGSDIIKPHTLEKLVRLAKYLKVYTEKVTKRFSSLYYIDLFAGIGLHQIEDTAEFVWGSAAIAMRIPIRFTNYKLCDVNPKCIENLQQIAHLHNVKPEFYNADCNEVIERIFQDIPSGAPCFCLVDPSGLQIEWQSLERLFRFRKIELLITFQAPGGLRVLKAYPSRFDEWFGPGAANIRKEAVGKNLTGPKLRAFLCEKYIDNLKRLGFRVVGPLKVGRPAYYLIFAAHHYLAEKIMNGIFLKQLGLQKAWPWL